MSRITGIVILIGRSPALGFRRMGKPDMAPAMPAGHKRFWGIAMSARPFAAFRETRAAWFVLVLQTVTVMFHSVHVVPMVF